MKQSLANKYRPKTFDDLTEQTSIKIILQNQLSSNTFKHAYVFTGPAGTGKTTSARIFANEINKGKGIPIEIDAASHGNVDDIRELVTQARLKPLDCDYKVFIIDECHCLSSAGWSAMLKLIEEPPSTAIFIMCTTEVHKIPKTIMSRCQQFNFQRISQKGICQRLHDVCVFEEVAPIPDNGYTEAIEYISKLADGGMRDALTLLDKCLAYSADLNLDNVTEALGEIRYETMFTLTEYLFSNEYEKTLSVIEELHTQGADLKQFIKRYSQFILDLNKYAIGCHTDMIQIPVTLYKDKLFKYKDKELKLVDLLSLLINLQNDIRYSATPKYEIEMSLLLFGR